LYRESFQTPPISRTNKWIIITTVALFFLTAALKNFGGFSLDLWLGLSLAGIKKGLIFQVLTFPLVQTGLMGTLFNCLILWFIGSELELRWGEKFYRKFLLLITLISGLCYVAISQFFLDVTFEFYPLVGLSGINYSLLVAYALIFPDRHLMFFFLFQIKAKYFCMIVGGIELYTAMFSQFGKSSWAHLIAMVVGFVLLRSFSLSSRGFNFNLSQWFSIKAWRERKASKRRQSFYVVSSEEEEKKEDRPKYWH
jgi:membrane associated rhomboid family serine protease